MKKQCQILCDLRFYSHIQWTADRGTFFSSICGPRNIFDFQTLVKKSYDKTSRPIVLQTFFVISGEKGSTSRDGWIRDNESECFDGKHISRGELTDVILESFLTCQL